MNALYGLAIYVLAIACMYGKPVYDSSAAGTASPGRGRFRGSGNTQSVVPKPFGLQQDAPGGRTGRVRPAGFGPVKKETRGGFQPTTKGPTKGSSRL